MENAGPSSQRTNDTHIRLQKQGTQVSENMMMVKEGRENR